MFPVIAAVWIASLVAAFFVTRRSGEWYAGPALVLVFGGLFTLFAQGGWIALPFVPLGVLFAAIGVRDGSIGRSTAEGSGSRATR